MEWLIRYGGDAEKVPLYDCKTSDRQPGTTNYVIGAAFIVYGVIAELIYILDLMVMVKKQHRRLSCYKIMIVLGMYDMAAISLNSLLTGYFWIKGTNYCVAPTLMFVTGAIALGLWCGACMNCFVLVINRLLDVWNKNMMQAVFKDERTYVVLLIPLAYSLYFCFFTSPLLFNSDQTAWFFFTFAPEHDHVMFLNYPHTANNLLIVVVTCLLYVQYSRVLLRHSKVGSGLSWAQKSFFIQCSSICMANLIAALIYVYMQFFPTPSYFVLVGHICWQLGHGFPAIVYLLLNRTIQREALAFLGIRKRTSVAHTRSTVSRTAMTDS
ncbi:hypothetical protein Y032_0430g1307 [Ancylostoma ceylanicum]|uniref:7TM GPCR serpentine receptor class x (Srx) domain-containing protein n=1 Tax=Ancylostoma ceylanicum TaxID=53326 RepID=A0A016X1I8_9BILA|nr:hypothetical protein Y032_0430g1307 [Ancylostoma ceylanicum]